MNIEALLQAAPSCQNTSMPSARALAMTGLACSSQKSWRQIHKVSPWIEYRDRFQRRFSIVLKSGSPGGSSSVTAGRVGINASQDHRY